MSVPRAMRGAAALILAVPAPSLIAAIPKAAARTVAPRADAGGTADADAAIDAAAVLAKSGDCAGALRLLDPLIARMSPGTPGRVPIQLRRMPCLAAAGRGQEVAPVLAELKTQAPRAPVVLSFEVFTEIDAGRFAEAADHLAALADTHSPALALMPGSIWRMLAQRLTIAGDEARRDRTALALATAGWTPADRPDLVESIAVEAIGALLAGGRTDEAIALLARIRRPGALADLAIERRYQPLWPAIERRLGPASGTAADDYARTTLDAFASRPDDPRTRRDAVRAFAALGRPDDVIATAAPIVARAGIDDVGVEIVLIAAQGLEAAGDRDGAIARLKPFAGIDLTRDPEAGSGVIALAELYHDTGRLADELMVARAALAGPDAFSAYGRGWLRRDEVCALAGLHRDAELQAAGDALKAQTAGNEAAAIEGLLCAGRDEEAAAIAVAALATPVGAERLADQFQPSDALFLHPASTLRPLWARLLQRHAVRAAFDRAARLLPGALRPAAAPRALPVLAGTRGDTTT